MERRQDEKVCSDGDKISHHHQRHQLIRRTSAEIIEEARMSVNVGGAKLVTSTRRPITPSYSSNHKWSRKYAFTRLFPILPEQRMLSKSKSTSLISVQSEPGSAYGRLSPLPEVVERPQSANDNHVDRRANTLRLRRSRPLSIVATSLKCDEIVGLIGSGGEGDREAPGFLPPVTTLSGLKSPRAVASDRTSDDTVTTTTISENDSERCPPSRTNHISNAALQIYMKHLNAFCSNGKHSESELEAWTESFISYLSNGKSAPRWGNQLQTLVVEDLFQALQILKPKSAIRIYAVLLSMTVSGKNLAKVCMELYLLCGSVGSLEIFAYDPFLANILRCITRIGDDDGNAITTTRLYMGRILHILTSDALVLARMANLNACEAILRYSREVVDWIHRGFVHRDIPSLAIATPIAWSIRNLLDAGDEAREQALKSGILQELCHLMNAFADDAELTTVGMRTLSILSTNEECCDQLITLEPDFFESTANWLRIYSKNQDVIVRLLFVLGNLLSVVERAQWQLFQADGVIQSLDAIFDHYLTNRSRASGCVESVSVAEDVLVKLTRVLANLAVHPGVGSVLCQNESIIDHLCAVLESAVQCRERSATSDELIVNALVALHNLSYYTITNGMDLGIRDRLGPAVISVTNSATSIHSSSQQEACSLLANLTRDIGFAEWIVDNKFHQRLIEAISSTNSADGDVQLAKSAAGALVNISRCAKHHQTLLGDGLLNSTLGLLKRSVATFNWHLAALAIKIICNMIRDGNERYVDYSLLKDVAQLLLQYTDEFTAICPKEISDKDLASHLQQAWEYDFCSASTHLMETLDETIM